METASGAYLPTLFGSGQAAFNKIEQILLGASIVGFSAIVNPHNQPALIFFGALLLGYLSIQNYYIKKLPYLNLKEVFLQLDVLLQFITTFFLVAIISSLGNTLLASDGNINWKSVMKLVFVFLCAIVFFIIIPRFFPRIKLKG